MGIKPIQPGPGQESVWDYPRPPRVEPCSKHIEVFHGGEKIVDSYHSLRVLETSHPPAYYVPPQDVKIDCLVKAKHTSVCEWKGKAEYFNLTIGSDRIINVAWSYLKPRTGYEALAGYLAFYPGLVDACFVDGEKVVPQPGGFYGGWITPDIVGPYKGEPGTFGW